jgi:hypothetical protein
VEQAWRAEIDKNLKTPRVIFVCGSSGDGKSELFRRIHACYARKVRFHLNATHSFGPQNETIQTLDDQFAKFKAGNQSLSEEEIPTPTKSIGSAPSNRRSIQTFGSKVQTESTLRCIPSTTVLSSPPVGVSLL